MSPKHFNLLEDEQKRIITSVYSDHLLSLGELREEYRVFMSNAEIVYEDALAAVKALDNQDAHDFLARRLYDMTAELVMSLLIIRDASKAPELFKKSANVYVRMTEEDVLGKSAYIKNFTVEDLESFKANDEEAEA